MFLTFLFRSAPEEGLYCKPKYRAKKFVFLKNKYISVILAFVVCSLKLVTSAVGISLPLIFSPWSASWSFKERLPARSFVSPMIPRTGISSSIIPYPLMCFTYLFIFIYLLVYLFVICILLTNLFIYLL